MFTHTSLNRLKTTRELQKIFDLLLGLENVRRLNRSFITDTEFSVFNRRLDPKRLTEQFTA